MLNREKLFHELLDLPEEIGHAGSLEDYLCFNIKARARKVDFPDLGQGVQSVRNDLEMLPRFVMSVVHTLGGNSIVI